MKKMKSILGVALGLSITACGGSKNSTGSSRELLQDSQTRSYSGTTGTCTISGPSLNLCMEFSYSGVLKSDPSGSASFKAQIACSSQNKPSMGLTTYFVLGATCSRGSAIGFCSISTPQTNGGEGYTARTVVVFESPFTVSLAQDLCANDFNGTFSITSP